MLAEGSTGQLPEERAIGQSFGFVAASANSTASERGGSRFGEKDDPNRNGESHAFASSAQSHLLSAAGMEPIWAEAWFQEEKVGRIVISSDCRLLWASPTGLKFLESGMPLGFRLGRLAASTRSNQARLLDLVRKAVHGKSKADALFASAEGEESTLLVQARACRFGEGIALQLRDLRPEVEDLPDLVSLYGLTRTEHQTICLLLNGLAVTAIAERLNKSVLTVRTHIKRAYSKLNISTKEQLFSTVLRLIGV